MLHFKSSSQPVERDLLDRMRDALAHRGPDGAGTWIANDGRIGLGHRRLSIIDLSSTAAQPMSNADDSLWISFNGEIYNHAEIRRELESLGDRRWKTDHSDTEVILHAFERWGIDCIHRFRGMFAFALWDGRSKELWLVRDRIGIKPLYYSVTGSRIAFASEIKALLEAPDQRRRIDEEALFYYLSFLTVPAPRTLFQGIRKLPAGCWMRIRDDGSIAEDRYWDVLERTVELEGVSEDGIAERLLAELRASVRLRCVSDVPVGAFLSGGIDSSANVALLAEGRESTVNTFTVGFRDQTSYHNETGEARRIANLFHAQYHEQLLGLDDLLDFLPRMIELQDEPIADPVCVPLYYLSKLARANGVVVCQVGEGSDELFIGYPTWRTINRLQRIGDLPVPRPAKGAALGAMRLLGRETAREYEYLRRSRVGLPVFWSGAEAFTEVEKQRLMSPRLRTRFFGMSGWNALAETYARFRERARSPSSLNWMSYSDLNLRLPELLLMRVDKMSMGQAVECRVPFLDHRLVEFAMSIPENIKFPNGRLKSILKRAVHGVIPDDVIARKKQGFGVPIDDWIMQRLGTHAKKEILAFVTRTDLFDEAAVNDVLEHGRASRTWFLLNLSLWWKRFLA